MKNKKVVHGKLIGMRTIKNIIELKANTQLLDKYLNAKTDPEYSFALELIKKGICFVALSENGTYKFYPSRFIGYFGNSMNAHQNNNRRDGRVTNAAISVVLGMKPETNSDLDKAYRDYCETLGFIANERGSFGVERKYWVVDLYYE